MDKLNTLRTMTTSSNIQTLCVSKHTQKETINKSILNVIGKAVLIYHNTLHFQETV